MSTVINEGFNPDIATVAVSSLASYVAKIKLPAECHQHYWRDRTCLAYTQLIMSWEAFLLFLSTLLLFLLALSLSSSLTSSSSCHCLPSTGHSMMQGHFAVIILPSQSRCRPHCHCFALTVTVLPSPSRCCPHCHGFALTVTVLSSLSQCCPHCHGFALTVTLLPSPSRFCPHHDG